MQPPLALRGEEPRRQAACEATLPPPPCRRLSAPALLQAMDGVELRSASDGRWLHAIPDR